MSSSYYPPSAYNQGSAPYTPSTNYTPATYAQTSGYASGSTSYSNYPIYSSTYTPTTTGSQYNNFQPYYAQAQAQRASPPPIEPPPPPDYTSINPRVAALAIQRLISVQLRKSGFDGCDTGALNKLEREVVGYVETLYERAHELANLSNRSGPIVTDLMFACKLEGLEIDQLKKVGGTKKGKKKQDTNNMQPSTLQLPDPPEPLPDLLPSDDEESGSLVMPVTLRALPHYTPALPPKHTYLRTPAAPLKKAALPSLEKKLGNAALVQESLKNLMLATEDNPDDEDGELLGAIVNGQAIGYQRKRWKLSAA